MAEVYHILPEVTTGKMRTPSKSQQFPAKFCAPIHRKHTIYGHPWVFLRESVFSVGRDPCVPPKNAYPAAGHTGPALRGAAVIQGGQSRPPLQTRNDRKHRRAARHARSVRSFIYWSRGGIYRATMWRRKLVSGDLRAGAGTGHPDRRRVSGGVPDVSGGVSADRLRRGVLA